MIDEFGVEFTQNEFVLLSFNNYSKFEWNFYLFCRCSSLNLKYHLFSFKSITFTVVDDRMRYEHEDIWNARWILIWANFNTLKILMMPYNVYRYVDNNYLSFFFSHKKKKLTALFMFFLSCNLNRIWMTKICVRLQLIEYWNENKRK